MIQRTLLAFGVALALLSPAPSHAGIERAGTTGANFLTVGTGPAVLAMGGAALGRSGSLDVVGWNPGALGWLSEGALVLSHANLDDQTAQEWLSVGGRFGRSGTHWAFSGLYQSEGAFEGRDASNQSTGAFNVSSLATGGTLAQAFGPHVSVGLGVKVVRENLGEATHGTGMAFDGGLSLRYGMFGLGLVAQNRHGLMHYDGTSYPFPANLGVGVALTHAASGVTAACDVNVPTAYYTNVRGGVEWRWNQRVALRAGYRAELGAEPGETLGGPTFGMGAGAHGYWFDYGYLLSGNEGGQHRIAISLVPGAMGMGEAGRVRAQGELPEFDSPQTVGPPAPGGAGTPSR